MKNAETEIKYQIKDPRILRTRLKAIGAKFVGREHEKDTWLAQRVEGQCGLINPIRVRALKDKGILTFKGGLLKSKYKKRVELEAGVDSPQAVLEILKNIGFSETRRIEKTRETYQYKGSSILLDKLPFMGYYIEIEGAPKDIGCITKLLGFGREGAIKDSYSELFKIYKMIKATQDGRYNSAALTFDSERSIR